MFRAKFCAVAGVVLVLNGVCRATVVSRRGDALELGRYAGRFLFWEKCEDRWNDDRNVTQVCCKGNYKCSSDVCKGNKVCGLGLFGDSLWCYVKDRCEDKDKDKDDKDKDDKDKKDKDKDNKDKDKDKKDKDKDKDKDDKDKDKDKDDKDKDKDKDDKDKEDKDKEDKDKDKDDKDKDDKEKESSTPSPSPSSSPPAAPSPTPSSSPIPPPPPPPSPPPPNNDDPLHCNGLRNRREIRDLTPAQRTQWQQAILSLREDRDANGDSEWDRLVRLHLQNSDEAHGGIYFAPWHRLFLLRLENALRKKQPDLALPYWDWSRDAADAALSGVWEANAAGGAQRNSGIQNGGFQNMDGRVPFQHIVLRNFTSGVSREMGLLWGWDSLNGLINSGGGFEAFSDGVESAHALPHIYIGGDMGDVFRAPNDPIFYLHHAFVDWLWYRRQERWGKEEWGGTHDFSDGSADGSADRAFNAFGKSARDAFHLDCVRYVASGVRNIGGRGGRRKGDDVCDDEMFNKEKGLSRERCRRGSKHLEEN